MATNTTSNEDNIIKTCSEFGGIAEECVEILERIDTELSEALEEVDELKNEIEELNDKLSQYE